MAASSVQYSIMNGYLQSAPSRFFDSAGEHSEAVDRILGLGNHGAGLGREISRLRGNAGAAAQCGSVSDGFSAAQGAFGATRVIFPLERLVTGKMFWERKEDGTWAKTDEESVSDYGIAPTRDVIDIIIDILALVARILNPIKWLHGRGVYDLGKHSTRMGDAILGLWAAVISLDAVQNIRAIYSDSSDGDDYRERTKERVANIVCDVIDLAALPFDFGYGMNGPPGLAIAGVVINCIAAGGYLVKEALCYR